jgi:uncharacterized membrane protein YbhN (UPF0104 family)
VIAAFGEFVISGNYVVGFIIFVILMIINFIVVTKGAGRVSEVNARFTLDAMPGKQMAIDADLNAGSITQEQAKKRRDEIAQEADFFGSMDGASKFVSGDAIAGILILLINVVGGLAIGVLQHNLSFGDASKLYVLLTIGDGLVAQIPSLLLSLATAIIVTRVTTSESMTEQAVSQISNPSALFISAGILAILGFVPGMPHLVFITLSLATAGLGSAVMLNVILWFGLIVSAGRGVNAAYGTAAIIGIILMLIAAALIFGLIDGQGRAERFIRLCARKLRMDEDHAAEVLEHLGNRLQGLASEPKLLTRVLGWALVNWLLDMLALYVFIRAFGGDVAPDALIVSFGLANILSVVPLTPGGLGIVEGIYIPTLVGFGLTRNVATVGVLSYRIAQYWLPILVGGFTYLSLRVGPFAIERKEKLRSLRKVTKIATEHPTTKYEFLEQYAPRDRTGQYPLPEIKNRFLLGDEDEE